MVFFDWQGFSSATERAGAGELAEISFCVEQCILVLISPLLLPSLHIAIAAAVVVCHCCHCARR